MATLVITFKGQTKTFLLNLGNEDVAEQVINKILDVYKPENWFVKDGYEL